MSLGLTVSGGSSGWYHVSSLRTLCKATGGPSFLCRAGTKGSGTHVSPSTSSALPSRHWQDGYLRTAATLPWPTDLWCVYSTWVPGDSCGTELYLPTTVPRLITPAPFTSYFPSPVLLPHPHWCFLESLPQEVFLAACLFLPACLSRSPPAPPPWLSIPPSLVQAAGEDMLRVRSSALSSPVGLTPDAESKGFISFSEIPMKAISFPAA